MLEELVAAGVEVRGLVVHRRLEGRPERRPEPHGRLGRLRVGQQALLERLGTGHHLGVVLEVVGEAAQEVVEGEPGGVARVAADLAQPGEDLVVGPRDDALVEPRRGPPRSPGGQHLGVRPGVLAQPVVQLLEPEVDEPVVRALLDDPLEEGAGDRADRLAGQPRHEEVGDDGAHLVVGEPAQPRPRHPDGLGEHPATVARPAEPAPDTSGDVGGDEPLAGDLLGEEVLGDELLEVAADLVLASRDDRGVRHREAERVPEQRGHREPVGQRADHGRLGTGVDVSPHPFVVEAQGREEHDGGEQQQRQRHEPHPAQAGPAAVVGRRRVHEAHPPDPAARAGRPLPRPPTLVRCSSSTA